jgi:hypothetical protein
MSRPAHGRRRAALRRLVPRRLAVALLTVVAGATVLTVGGSSSSGLQSTADMTQFDPGNIISDQEFFFGGGMTTAAVQAFIDDKNRNCVTGSDGTPCLRVFRQDTTTRASDAYCNAYPGAAQESAAVILTKVAMACNINPKVLLVLIQKEQALLTDSGATLYATRYRSATGFGCPDTGAGCNATYYGFQNQVYNAAHQFQRYRANPTGWTYQAGRTVNILYSPNTACGSAPVRIANQATAGLYIYTPYQPNAAALRAGYGTGDSCSSYGNRNFWAYFTDYFGSTQGDAIAAGSPKGVVDGLQLTASGFLAWGWSVDPDSDVPVGIRATVDGDLVANTTADGVRTDVAAALGVGPNHGFGFTGLLSYGTHRVCIEADNASGPGTTAELYCQSLTFSNRAPQVGLEQFAEQADGTLAVSGWDFDRVGASGRIDVHVDDQLTVIRAGSPRPDVQAVFPAAGPNSGFAATLGPLPAGAHVCVYSVDEVALGNNYLIGCQTLPYQAPIGWITSVAETTDGQVHLSGWAMDPSAPITPLTTHVYVDGRVVTWAQAAGSRPDVAAAFAAAGPAHGFDVTIPVASGTRNICVYAINVGYAGPNPSLGCRTVTLQYTPPLGSVDAAVSIGGGRLAVAGWAWDPSAPSTPLSIHYWVDGQDVAAAPASVARPDVAATYPAAGPAHGFWSALDVGYGTHQVCAYAINVGVPGANPQLGCRTVDVPHQAPIGAVGPMVSGAPGQVAVWGWTFDPDDPTATTSVRVLLDGVDQGLLTAGTALPGVGDAYPAAGAAHGFGTLLSAGPGQHQICVSGLAASAQAPPASLGCYRVTT